MKKLLAFLLLTALVLSACGGESGGNTDDSERSGGDKAAESTTASPTEPEKIYPELPPVDLGGYEFTFLSWGINSADWAEWDHRDFTAEEINGDIINDAVYQRNQKIEEKYNITINEIGVQHGEFNSMVTRSIGAGDDNYDVVGPQLFGFPPLAQNGNFIDWFSVPNLDLKMPWWDQGTIRDLSIIGRLFILQGDLLIVDNDSMEAMIFNKRIHQDHALDNLYDIVKRGEWTFSKLYEMSRGVAQDLNGDGVMYIKDDLFGIITQADTNVSFFVSGGEKICAKDANDFPIITFGSERGYRITDIISEIMLDEENVVHLHRYEGKFAIYDEQVKMMEEDRALFSWIRMRIVERLRGMETDFGLLPLPKLDAVQEKYITHMNPHTGRGLAIPVTASNLGRTGMILEDLSAESRYTLQPAYYEINLKGKYARDDESYEMLDIILNNTAHDIGYVYNFGSFAGDIMLRHGQNKKSDYASAFEKVEAKMQIAIDKVVEAYENLD